MPRRLRCVMAVAAGVLSLALAFSMSAAASIRRVAESAGRTAAAPARGGSVTDLVNGGEWPGLDPATNTEDAADATENNAIFGQLFVLGGGNVILPDIAMGYAFSNHNLTVSINLRPGVKFQDGSELTASVAAWNISRDLDPAYACICLANFKAVTSITTKGKYVVVLHLSSPFAPIITAFINEAPNWMASEADFKSAGEATFEQHPVGAGPFEVVSDEPSSLLVLKRFAGYWQKGHPYLENLTFQSTDSDNADIDALRSGHGQYSLISTLSLVPTVTSDSALKFIKGPATTVEFVALNEKTPPFSSLAARQALQYATNAKQLVTSVDVPVQSFTAPGMLYYQKTVPGYDAYNLAKAEKLWKSVGAPKFSLDMTDDTLFWIQESDALAQQWSAAGIEASVVVDNLQSLQQKLASSSWVACTANWGSFDPGVALPAYFSSTGNYSGTSDPTLDGLMNQGVQFVSPTTRNAVYLKIDERLDSEAEAVFEYAKSILTVTAKNLQGINASTDNLVQWQDVWMK